MEVEVPTPSFVSASAVEVYESRMAVVKGVADRQRLARELRLVDWAAVWWQYAVVRLAPSTRLSYEAAMRHHILPTLGEIPLAELDTPTVAVWLDALSREITLTSATRARRVLSSCLGRAAERGLMPRGNPVTGLSQARIPRVRLRRPLSPEQIEALRQATMLRPWLRSTYKPTALRSAVLISVMAYGGLRPGEAMGLKVGDVDLQSRGVWVRDTVTIEHRIGQTKTVQPRFAPLPAAAMQDVAWWAEVLGGAADDWLFPGRSGIVSATTFTTWRQTFHDACNYIARRHPEWRFEFEGLTPYILRHSCASMRVRAGDPLAEIAQDMGHTVHTLALNYVHVIRAQHRRPVSPIDTQIAIARRRFDTDRIAHDLYRQLSPGARGRPPQPIARRLNPDAHWILGWEDRDGNLTSRAPQWLIEQRRKRVRPPR